MPADSIPAPQLFRSFWLAGFECSCQINAAGRRLDMTAAVKHDVHASQDYARLREVGIGTARDGVRWPLMDMRGRYNFSSWRPMLEAARKTGVQVIWDLCHYGWPTDVDIFSSAFLDRFAKFSAACARFLREQTDDVPFFTPVNEINFFAWAACRQLIYPYARGRDGELKRQLVRASIEAIQAVWAVEPRARFVFPEPLIHNVPPKRHPENTGPARSQRASQFEAWDMIAGRTAPELGGQERFLDIVGVNFYAANEWEMPGGRKLHWDGKPLDERWLPLHCLLAEVWQRYQRPFFIAETSHYGVGRAPWILEVASEVYEARKSGVPVQGICLYPILDRFDWEDQSHWHNSGLWDYASYRNGHFERVLNPEYAAALRQAQHLLAAIGCV